jgi:hypothetical protein
MGSCLCQILHCSTIQKKVCFRVMSPMKQNRNFVNSSLSDLNMNSIKMSLYFICKWVLSSTCFLLERYQTFRGKLCLHLPQKRSPNFNSHTQCTRILILFMKRNTLKTKLLIVETLLQSSAWVSPAIS